jgi:AraC family transcriptional regulator, regulatory protein of adaptative response / DNA-3-methyladenine glycosylase II
MTTTRESMLERFFARDRASDGRFLTGVTTTGIYCLPSCPARRPLPENVRFFRTEEEARGAGLRPCRRCRPDHFYRRFDPELERAEGVAAAVRADPAGAGDAAALAASAGVGATRLNALFRRHFHLSPAAFLARERVAAACRALAAGAGVTEAAFAAGFESLSAFHLNFRRRTGLSPGAYRALGEARGFVLALPPGFRADAVLAYLGRDPLSPVERVSGAEAAKALRLEGAPAVLRMRFEGAAAGCAVESAAPPSAAQMREAHAAAVRMLGLGGDPAAFERRMARRPELARLVAPRRGLRIPLTADPWECLAWAIVGQQVNLPFAYALRRTVVELAGEGVDGMRAHPTAAAVAALDPADLAVRRFSRRKAEYLVDTARLVASGELTLDPAASATATERRLLEVRGIGPWTAQYFLMRGCGFADCVPAGDAALSAALARFFALEARPDAEGTRARMAPFAPFRSLATFHLWASLGDP